jgi:hypothetical protein
VRRQFGTGRRASSTGAAAVSVPTIASAASHIYGADGNNTPDEGTDMAQQQDQAAFDANKLTNDELNALKALAKQRGTYYQGAVAFNSGHKIPDGLVFIDTVSGNNITPSTPLEDYAQASVQTDAGQGSNNTFRGCSSSTAASAS